MLVRNPEARIPNRGNNRFLRDPNWLVLNRHFFVFNGHVMNALKFLQSIGQGLFLRRRFQIFNQDFGIDVLVQCRFLSRLSHTMKVRRPVRWGTGISPFPALNFQVSAPFSVLNRRVGH